MFIYSSIFAGLIFSILFCATFFLLMTKFGFNKKITIGNYLFYLLWALCQQMPIAFSWLFFFYYIEPVWLIASCTLAFGLLYHIPNLPLILITALFGAIQYSALYFELTNFPYIVVCHAFCGAYLKENGFELRVWFSYFKK